MRDHPEPLIVEAESPLAELLRPHLTDPLDDGSADPCQVDELLLLDLAPDMIEELRGVAEIAQSPEPADGSSSRL